MEKFSAIAQISILLLIAFLIGIIMTWWYLRRRYRAANAYEGETKDLEIQRLSGELKRYSSMFGGISPEIFKKNQEGILLEREEEIKSLKNALSSQSQEMDTSSIDLKLEELEAKLSTREKELSRLSNEMEELSVNGEVLSPKEYMAWAEAALEAKTAEITQLSKRLESPQVEKGELEALPMASMFSDGQMLAEQLGELRWELSEKEEMLSAKEVELAEIKQAQEAQPVAQLEGTHDEEKNQLAEQLGELRWELSEKEEMLSAKEAELTELKQAQEVKPLDQQEEAHDEEKNQLAEQLGELRWELSDKEEQLGILEAKLTRKTQDLTRLSAELGQMKFVDMDGEEKNPWDFVTQLRGELEAKEVEMTQLASSQGETQNEEKTQLAEQLGELRWELSEKAEQVGTLESQLDQKVQNLTRLSAELGQMKFVDMDGEEKNPWDFVTQLRGELDAKEAEMAELLQAKEAEIAELGRQQEEVLSGEKNQLTEQLGELRWELSEKAEQVGTLESQLDKKVQDLTRLSAELGQMKFVDMDGEEKNPWDFVTQLRGELDAKEVEMAELLQAKEAEIAELGRQQEEVLSGEKNQLTEQLGELRWELSEKAEQVGTLESQLDKKVQDLTRLSAELGQMKFVDMDGEEKNPWDFVTQLRGELDAKEVEMAELLQAKEAEIAELGRQQEEVLRGEKNQLTEQLGELRWELSEKAEQVGTLESQLDKKAQDLTRLSAELGQMKFVDMDGEEKNPWDFVTQLRGELDAKEAQMAELLQAKEAEIAELGRQQEEVLRGEKNQLTEQLGELRWELSEKAEQVGTLESQLDKKAQDLTRLSAELGQMKFVDMDGEEKNPWDFVTQLRGELDAKETELNEKVQAKEAELTQLASQKEEVQRLNENNQAEILRLEGALAQLQIEGQRVSPGELQAHYSNQLQEKERELAGAHAEMSQLKQQFQSIGLDNGESLTEFMARKNMEHDAKEVELNRLKEQLQQFNWQGIQVTPEEYMAKRNAELETKDQEIEHLLNELSQLSIDGVQLRPADFASRMNQQLQHQGELVKNKEEEIHGLKAELDKLKYVVQEQQNQEEDLDWREREAELVRLSAENEQLRQGYSARGISIDETYMDFIPEDIYKLLVEYGDEGISLSNHDGYFLVFNDRLQDLTEYSKSEANDTSEKIFLEKIYPDSIYRTEVAKQIANIPEDGSFNSIRTQITTKYGNTRELDVASTTFYHKGMKYYLSAYVDVDGKG